MKDAYKKELMRNLSTLFKKESNKAGWNITWVYMTDEETGEMIIYSPYRKTSKEMLKKLGYSEM